MRRVGLWVVVALVAMVGVACIPIAPPPPPPPPPPPVPQCVTLPAPPAPTPTPPLPGTPTTSVQLTQVSDLNAITMATRAGDPRLYVATQAGVGYAVDPAAPTTHTQVFDLSARVKGGGEQGFLGMAFSNDGTKLYVHYSAPVSGNPAGATTTVAELTVTNAVPGVFAFSRVIFTTDHSGATNHNGGSLLVGPDDGMLYLALGDGGGGNDQGAGQPAGGNGQSLAAHPGKILRIDPTAAGALQYRVPCGSTGNPFTAVAGAKPEIWSYGLRNPFRFSFDRTTHDLWIGDVGQGAREEVDFVAVDDPSHPGGKGANFGWNRREGLIAGPNGSPPDPNGGALVAPIFDIDHSQPDRAIIGGYVYRGTAIPGLVGQYLYTDNQNGRIRSLTPGTPNLTPRDLGVIVSSPASFGEDDNGELYVLSLSDGVYRIDAP